MKRNTDRLINIVQDLLLLSELEEKSVEVEKSRLEAGRVRLTVAGRDVCVAQWI